MQHLARNDPSIKALLGRLHVLSREFTGVGSFTKFDCGEVADSRTRNIGLDQIVTVPSVAHGLGAVLFCKGDHPELLEIHAYGDERWDGQFEDFAIN
jgi:hypothetical protein